MIKEPKRERLMVPFTTHHQQIAELEAENMRLRAAARMTLDYWRRNSPASLQYDKLGDYIRLLEEALDTR